MAKLSTARIPMLVPMKLLLALTLLMCGDVLASRETVNFDFAWRFELDKIPPPPPVPPTPPPVPPAPIPQRLASCKTCEHGVQYGTGTIGTIVTENYTQCCDACAKNILCLTWDWNPSGGNCYLKNNVTPKKSSDRWASVMPHRNTSAVSSHSQELAVMSDAVPPQAGVAYDDFQWAVVDAPHDMLINQQFNPANSKGMAYLPRNSGWYRKHFVLPLEWKGKSVWLYIEGSFHTTTSYLNGEPLGFHQAAYTSFWLRLDNATAVKYGEENVLALYVDASFGTGWWYEGGGLIRHNHLIATDTTHLEPDGTWTFAKDITDIKPRGGSGAGFGKFSAASVTMVTSAEVTNHGFASSSVSVRATLVDDAVAMVVATSVSQNVPVSAGDTIVINTSTPMTDANVWSIQSPDLYTVTVDVLSEAGDVLDTYNYSAGIRTVNFTTTGLKLNNEAVKVRGFCDHSNFAGVGGAVPDRVNLYRTQMLRSVGANAWRMAHNPPIPARLDFMDRLGMLALDENRDFGKVGESDKEPLPAQLTDMRDLVKRDRKHASVMAWSFCNEGECDAPGAEPFRQTSYEFDGTRPVTQNHYGPGNSSVPYLDIQGFSHRHGSDFDTFHKNFPSKPMMATECCSCMSQRGVDQDACPSPADGGCKGGAEAGLRPGDFYNNNIGQCTAVQVIESDERETVSGTFVWSGFDYYGEARGFPQNTKCRGTVSDLAGFRKETSYWLRSWWLSNISDTDYGKPPLVWQPTSATTVFIVESWQPAPAVYHTPNRTINVYTNADGVKLQVNGKDVTEIQRVAFFGQATFTIQFEVGSLTAIAVDVNGVQLSNHTITTQITGAKTISLSLDAPSVATGTGSYVVADGEDVAMVRATLTDGNGNFAYNASTNVTFTIVSGPGKIWTTHNGDPANDNPRDVTWAPAYHGLVRAFVRTTVDGSTSTNHRRRMREVDVDSGVGGSVNVVVDDVWTPSNIILKAEVVGDSSIEPVQLVIPVSNDVKHLPQNVAASAV